MTQDTNKEEHTDICDNCEGFEYDGMEEHGYCNDPQSEHYRHVMVIFHPSCDRMYRREKPNSEQ